MTINKNAAGVAVAAEPCQKQANPQQAAGMDCRGIFGVPHPEDVIIPIHTAADALEWLAEVFKTIGAEAETNRRIESLASMGAFLAADMSDLAECSYAAMLQSIRNGSAA